MRCAHTLEWSAREHPARDVQHRDLKGYKGMNEQAVKICGAQIRLLTIAEACEALRVSRPTLYRLGRDERIRIIKIGKRAVVRSDDIAAFIDGLPAKNDYGKHR